MCMERLHVWCALIHHHYTTEGKNWIWRKLFQFQCCSTAEQDCGAVRGADLASTQDLCSRPRLRLRFWSRKKHAISTTLNKALTRGRLDGGPTHTFACLLREIVGHLVARVPLQWSSFGLQEVLNVIVLSISDELDFSRKKNEIVTERKSE